MEIAKFQLIRAKGSLMRQYSLGRLACLFFLVPGSAFGATIYTAKTGNDNNTCAQAQSEATPRLTISGGIECLSSGDTLIVKAGTYNENLDALPSGSAGNYTTVRSYSGDNVILSRSGGATLRGALWSNKSYLEVDGLTITGPATNDLYEGIKFINNTHHIRLLNITVYNAAKNGISDQAAASVNQGGNNYYYKILSYNNGGVSEKNHGFYSTTSNNIFEDSTFHSNSGYGISMWNSRATTNNNIVRRCKSYNNGIPGSRGGIGFSGSNNIAYNNLVWGNGSGGIWALSGNGNKFYHNTIYNNLAANSGGGVTTASATNTVIMNNIIYANTNNILNRGSGTVFATNLENNPSFANAAANDFHIQSGSPARDTGTAVAEATDDFDQVLRPQGAGIDIGAFEYTGLAPPPPSASTPQPPLSFSAL